MRKSPTKRDLIAKVAELEESLRFAQASIETFSQLRAANARLAEPSNGDKAREVRDRNALIAAQYRVNWAIITGQGRFEPLHPKAVADLLKAIDAKCRPCPMCGGKAGKHLDNDLQPMARTENSANCRLGQVLRAAREAVPYFNTRGL